MSATPPLPVDLSGIRLSGAGLARQLYQGLRERILDGRLAGRSRLPASRDLARMLGVSRNTVTRALDQLYAEGYIEGRVGDGTYVADVAGLRATPALPVQASPASAAPARNQPAIASRPTPASSALCTSARKRSTSGAQAASSLRSVR